MSLHARWLAARVLGLFEYWVFVYLYIYIFFFYWVRSWIWNKPLWNIQQILAQDQLHISWNRSKTCASHRRCCWLFKPGLTVYKLRRHDTSTAITIRRPHGRYYVGNCYVHAWSHFSRTCYCQTSHVFAKQIRAGILYTCLSRLYWPGEYNGWLRWWNVDSWRGEAYVYKNKYVRM